MVTQLWLTKDYSICYLLYVVLFQWVIIRTSYHIIKSHCISLVPRELMIHQAMVIPTLNRAKMTPTT